MTKLIARLTVGALLSVSGIAGLIGMSTEQAGASCTSAITNAYVYVPNGTSFYAVTFPNTFWLNSSVVFNPANGYYYQDRWSNGYDVISGTIHWYFVYNKIANPSNAYIAVTHC